MKSLRSTLAIVIFLSPLLISLQVQANEEGDKLEINQKLQAQDHNSTRSNRGSIKNTQGDQANNQKPVNNQASQLKKGRNPQTGKEINLENNSQKLQAQDHNSTRSNKGQKKQIEDSMDQKQLDNQKIKLKKGRNPQTGKEINSKKKTSTGSN